MSLQVCLRSLVSPLLYDDHLQELRAFQLYHISLHMHMSMSILSGAWGLKPQGLHRPGMCNLYTTNSSYRSTYKIFRLPLRSPSWARPSETVIVNSPSISVYLTPGFKRSSIICRSSNSESASRAPTELPHDQAIFHISMMTNKAMTSLNGPLVRRQTTELLWNKSTPGWYNEPSHPKENQTIWGISKLYGEYRFNVYIMWSEDLP